MSVEGREVDTLDKEDTPTKRSTEYTSENYKVEISNLPKKVKFHVVQILLIRQFKLKPHKIRLGQGKAFVTFRNEQERDEAIQKLDGSPWKDKTLIAQSASPRDDLVAKKRKLDDGNRRHEDTTNTDMITDEMINNQVCVFWNKTYEDQIAFKDHLMRSVLNMSRQVSNMCPNLKSDDPALFEWTKKNDKISCQFDGITPSPVLRGYRNKYEFNVGHDGEIGFKFGRYKNGSDRVCQPPKDCPIMQDKIYQILDVFRLFLQEKSKLRGYDLVTHEGNYRQMTIRCNQGGEYLIIVDLHPQDATPKELDWESEELVKMFESIGGVVSIFFNISDKSSFSSANNSLKLVHGQENLIEQLCVNPEKPLSFRIGPVSFFQVNTKASELLYRSIIEVAQLDSKSFVLDVGCGIGTIGLSLAHQVNHVIGIEIVPQAIEDAKENAKLNDINNVSYYAGRAEDLIGEALRIMGNKMIFDKIDDGEIVAIVDPPRAGFANSFIKTIRASGIKKLIYVACDPKANTNLLTLCRPKSKAYQGEPFVPVRAKGFDLFPFTKFCELVLVYERLSNVANKSE